MVQTERDQSEAAREGQPESDFWRRMAHRFRPRPANDSAPDPTVTALLRLIRPTDQVIDVGAGGGRLAVPLAERSERMVAVEPSEAMRTQLLEAAATHRIENIETVAARWDEASIEQADVVLCSHVVYGIDDIAPFVAKLHAHARRTVVIVMHARAPMWNFYPLWRMVHGESRRPLPALPEFLEVLQGWKIEYQLYRLPESALNQFSDFDEAVDYSMQRLFLAPGSEKAKRLPSILREVLEEKDGDLRFVWSRPTAPRLVTWSPLSPAAARRPQGSRRRKSG